MRTQGKWEVELPNLTVDNEAEGKQICDCVGYGTTNAEDEANAEFICKAVNSHDALVEALSELVEIIDNAAEECSLPNNMLDSFTTQPAKAALKLAE